MSCRRHLRLGFRVIGFWWVLAVGHKTTPGHAAETPDPSATPSEGMADVLGWIRELDGEVVANPENPDQVIEVRLDRTRGIDPLFTADALYEADLRKLQLLPKLTSLTLEARDALSDEGLAHLGDLTKLKTLNLRRTRIRGRGLVHLQHLDDLEDLDLSHCDLLTDDLLAHLAALTNLRRLALDGGGSLWISDENWKQSLRLRRVGPMLLAIRDRELSECRHGVGNSALKHIGQIRSLRALSLRLTEVTDAGLPAIADLDNLEELDLSYTAISGDGLRKLIKLKKLKRLVLDFTYLADRDLAVVKEFPQLISLSIRGTTIGDDGLVNLSDATRLRQLNLDGTEVTDQGLHHLGKLSDLKELSLKDTTITLKGAMSLPTVLPRFTAKQALLSTRFARGDENGEIIGLDFHGQAVEVAELADMAIFEHVEVVDLRNTQITDEGLAVMASFAKLNKLYLSGTSVTDAGLVQLAENKSLTTLRLAETKVTLVGLLHLVVDLQGRSVEEALLASGSLTQDKSGCSVDLRGLAASSAALKSLSAVREIRKLFVDGPQINDESASLIATHSHLAALWIDGGALGPDGLDALTTLPELKDLWLTHVKIRGSDLRSLEQLPQLASLSISGCELKPITLFALTRLKQLRTLIVGSLDFDHETLAEIGNRLPKINVVISQRDAIARVRASSSQPNISTTVEGPEELRTLFGDDYFEQAQHVYLSGSEPLGIVRGLTTLTAIGITFAENASPLMPDFANLADLIRISLYGSKLENEDLKYLVNLPRLEDLDLQRTTISDDGLQYVGRMVGLKHLSLGEYGTQIHDKGLRHLKALIQLERLELNRTLITDAGLEHLAGLPNLKELQLRETAVNVGVTRLASLKQLQRLDLYYTNVTDETAAALGAIESLTSVDFSHTFVTAATAETLQLQNSRLQISPRVFPNHDEEQPIVRELGALRVRLSANCEGRVTEVDARVAPDPSGVMQLVRQLPQVMKLRVGPNCTDADLEGIGEVSMLTVLNLSNSKVSDRGLVHLRGLTSLTDLNLSGTLISDAAGHSIATHQGLAMLHLGRTKISDAMLERLTALTHLKILSIDGAAVSARGLTALGRLANLEYLYIRENPGVTDSDVDAIQRSLPGCRIIRRRSR